MSNLWTNHKFKIIIGVVLLIIIIVVAIVLSNKNKSDDTTDDTSNDTLDDTSDDTSNDTPSDSNSDNSPFNPNFEETEDTDDGNSLADNIIDSVNEIIRRTEPATTTSIATTAAPTPTARPTTTASPTTTSRPSPTTETFYVYGTTHQHLQGTYHKMVRTLSMGVPIPLPEISNLGSHVFVKEDGSKIVYYKSNEKWNFCDANNGQFVGQCFGHLSRRGNLNGSENNPDSGEIFTWTDSDVHITYDIADIP